MQISRRHTLAPDLRNKALITSALKSNLSVQISPLQNKRRHTLTTEAILNSARKAVDQAHKVAEQRRRSICQTEGPRGPSKDGAFMEGPERRTPLKPANSRAFQRDNEVRAASTPEGNVPNDSFILRVIMPLENSPLLHRHVTTKNGVKLIYMHFHCVIYFATIKYHLLQVKKVICQGFRFV